MMKIVSRFAFWLVLSLLSPVALADSGHVLTQISALLPMLASIAYLIGLILFGTGIYLIYKRGQNPQQYPVGMSIRYLLSGTLLLSLLTTYSVVTTSTIDPSWSGSGSRDILALDRRALQEFESAADRTLLGTLMPAELGAIVIGFIYLVGFLAFIRGLFLIKEVGQNQQNGTGVGKVLTHLIGGVIAMNLSKFACFVGSFFSSGGSGFC